MLIIRHTLKEPGQKEYKGIYTGLQDGMVIDVKISTPLVRVVSKTMEDAPKKQGEESLLNRYAKVKDWQIKMVYPWAVSGMHFIASSD